MCQPYSHYAERGYREAALRVAGTLEPNESAVRRVLTDQAAFFDRMS